MAMPEAGLISRDEGFAILPQVLSQQEATKLSEAVDRLQLDRSRAGARHMLRFPVADALARDPRLLDIAAAVLGAEAHPFSATLFDKSPRANWLVVWHQDTALPVRERCDVPGWGPWSIKGRVLYAHAPAAALNRVVALRVHLDNSTSLNGPLRVLPGTHEKGVLRDEEIAALTMTVRPVECVACRGSIVVMRPLLVHSSSKAIAPAPRRVIHIEYTDIRAREGGLSIPRFAHGS
jgi:ectoine hydroxylase-related dioxygenase (phytanoyl-CoA dioxygenase family)